MTISVYCVRDQLIGYGIPILRDNDAVASRSFAYDINEVPNSPYKANPEHYQLFKIGEFDTVSGIINSIDPVLIVNASDLIKKE